MESPSKALLVTMLLVGCCSAAPGDDNPFPTIARLPERRLFEADENGHPRIKAENKGEVARLAASPESPPELRFMAVWGLAISGYSPESAAGLIKVARDGANPNDRNYAAMGLRNFTLDLPPDTKKELHTLLCGVVKSEGSRCPDEIVRVVVSWGGAAWVAGQFKDDLAGHLMEIEILQKLPARDAIPRLLEIYRTTARNNSSDSYGLRSKVGQALVDFRDKRGIDVLDTLLDAASVPVHDGAPNHQYRHNVLRFILRAVGEDFAYLHDNYDPSIDQAVLKFREWWLQKRYEFEFPKKASL